MKLTFSQNRLKIGTMNELIQGPKAGLYHKHKKLKLNFIVDDLPPARIVANKLARSNRGHNIFTNINTMGSLWNDSLKI